MKKKIREEALKPPKKELYKFQQEALAQVGDRDNILLAAEMGTGKTLMSITQSERWNSPILICLVLKSTVQQWIDELESQTERKTQPKKRHRCIYELHRAAGVGYWI